MNAALTNQEIYDRIYDAISERRLLPGTKLSEERLAQTFHVSRTRIREVLMRLSQELVIELHLNRGAFVACPTPHDLQQVFAVRRALERAIVGQLSTEPSSLGLASIRRHLEEETQARERGDRAALARLTGEFHVRLAEITQNRLFSDNLRRLVALTSLAIAQYDARSINACPEHEHEEIIAAIDAGDARRAERAMLDHLLHVEHGVQQQATVNSEIDFAQIFAVAPAPDTASAAVKRKRKA